MWRTQTLEGSTRANVQVWTSHAALRCLVVDNLLEERLKTRTRQAGAAVWVLIMEGSGGVTPTPLTPHVYAHMWTCTYTQSLSRTFVLILLSSLSGHITRWHMVTANSINCCPPETANHLTAFDPIRLHAVPQCCWEHEKTWLLTCLQVPITYTSPPCKTRSQVIISFMAGEHGTFKKIIIPYLLFHIWLCCKGKLKQI